MQKNFCDKCGNEFKKLSYNIKWWDFFGFNNQIEICKNCAFEFRKFIRKKK